MKIKLVSVTLQNIIQYESFINAIDIMLERKIKVDIFIPTNKKDKGLNKMYDEFYNIIDKKKYNVYRKNTNKTYDILFIPYENEISKDIKRKYTIKYMYGLTTKPEFSLSPKINYIFDAFLCYGMSDAACLQNYGICFQIGNIKYLHNKEEKRNNLKKTILYLPTYGKDSSIELIGNELLKLKDNYNIIIKPHHGTEYLNNKVEANRRKFLKENFPIIHSSKTNLAQLINESDLIISDKSGAVFDAICMKKPVIMYYDEKEELYGEYTSLVVQIAKEKFILSLTKENIQNLENTIKNSLKIKQQEKQNTIFNKLFCCENNQTKEKFIDFLDKIEDGVIEEDYYKIHQNFKEELNNLYYIENQFNYSLKEKELYEKRINDLNLYINNLKEETNKILNSTSWKITKPLRKIKNILK